MIGQQTSTSLKTLVSFFVHICLLLLFLKKIGKGDIIWMMKHNENVDLLLQWMIWNLDFEMYLVEGCVIFSFSLSLFPFHYHSISSFSFPSLFFYPQLYLFLHISIFLSHFCPQQKKRKRNLKDSKTKKKKKTERNNKEKERECKKYDKNEGLDVAKEDKDFINWLNKLLTLRGGEPNFQPNILNIHPQ